MSSRIPTRQPDGTRRILGIAFPSLLFIFLALAAGVLTGLLVAQSELSPIRKRGTNVGHVVGECHLGQVVRWNGTALICDNDPWDLPDLDDVEARNPKPKDQQCLCFSNLTDIWAPQGPFATPDDLPDFINGTIIPCENLPENLCSALRWGTPVGIWDALTNTPFLSSNGCPFGDFYVVLVAGNTSLDGTDKWDVGDALVCSSLGWHRIGKDFPIISVNGMTEALTLGLDDLIDVDLTGQMNGHFLQRVGGLWTPQELAIFLNNLTDVEAANPMGGDALLFDGSVWHPNSNCCIAGGDIAQRQGARIILSSSQGIPSTASGFDKVEFDTVLNDPGNNFDAVMFEYVAPITGYYGIWANMLYPINGVQDISNLEIRARLYLNGVNVIASSRRHLGDSTSAPPRGATGPVTMALGYILLNPGDRIHVETGQTNSGNHPMFLSASNSIFTIVFYGPV